MTYIIKDKDEATSYIENPTPELLQIVNRELSVYYPNYQFMPRYRMGLTDGKKKYYKVFNKFIVFPKGLASALYSAIKNEVDIIYEKTKYSDNIPSKSEFELFIKTLNIPFEPRDYQLSMAYNSIRLYRHISVSCTNSGKSLGQYLIVRWLLSQGFKVVMLVPRVMLVDQMYSDFKDYGWDNIDEYCKRIGGSHNKDEKVKEFSTLLTITTWQSVQRDPHLFEDVDAVLVDEIHGAGSQGDSTSDDGGNVYEKILMPAAKGARWRLGFTGTMPPEAIGKMTLLSSFGKEKVYLTVRESIERGYSTPVNVNAVYLDYPDDDRVLVKSLTTNTKAKKIAPQQRYQNEIKFLYSHPKRQKIISKIISKISSQGRNCICLFDRVEYGERIALATFKEKFGFDIDIKQLMEPNEYNFFFISGKGSSSKSQQHREEIRKIMDSIDGGILFGTDSILSTGVNIKKLNDFFNLSGGKSFIKINQSIGRMLRKHHSKNIVNIWDFIDNLGIKKFQNYMLKQFNERLVIYEEHEYDIIEKIIKL